MNRHGEITAEAKSFGSLVKFCSGPQLEDVSKLLTFMADALNGGPEGIERLNKLAQIAKVLA